MSTLRLLLMLASLAATVLVQAQTGNSRPTQGFLNNTGPVGSIHVDADGRTVLFDPSTGGNGTLVVQNAAGSTLQQQGFFPVAPPNFIFPTVTRVVQAAGPGREIAAYGSQQVGDFVGLNGINTQSILSSLYLADSTGTLSFLGGIKMDSCLSATDVYRAPGGEVYVAGKYFQIDPLPFSAERSNFGHYFLACLTAQGTVRWARRLADADTSYGYAGLASLQPMGRHGVRVFTGHRAHAGSTGPGYNLHVADFDSAGRASRIRTLPNQDYRINLNQVYTGQAHYYFFRIVNFGGGTDRALLQIVRTDTALVESEAINLFLDAVTNEYTLVERPAGGFYLSGITFINNVGFEYLAVVDSLGRVHNAGLLGECAGFSASQHNAGLLPNGDVLALYSSSSGAFSRVIVTDSSLISCHPKGGYNGSGTHGPLGWVWQPGGLSVSPKAMQSIPFTYTQWQVDSSQEAWARHESTCGFRNVQMFPDTLRICASGTVLNPQTPAQNGSTYRWSTGDTAATLPVTRSGRYWLDYTGPCYDLRTDTITVLLSPRPVLGATDILLPLCPGDSVRLSGGEAQPGVRYSWNLLTHLTHIVGPEATVIAPKTAQDSLNVTQLVFTLQAIAGPGCDTSARFTVGFAPGARGRLVPLSPAPADTLVALVNSNASVLSWASASANVLAPITDTAHVLWRGWAYPQTLTATIQTDQHCRAERTYTRPGPPDDPDPLPAEIVQNLITANGDGLNDHFTVTNAWPGVDYKLTLHNRWGGQVFEGAYTPTAWPASPLPGLYFYRLTGRGKVWKGWVEVVEN